MNFVYIKERTEALFGQHGIMLILFILVITVLSGATNFFFIGLILGPLLDYLYTHYILHLVREEKQSYTFGLSAMQGIRVVILSILETAAIVIGLLFFIVPGILVFFYCLFINFLIRDNPEMGMIEVVKQSIELGKGHLWALNQHFFSLIQTFLYILLGLLLGAIGSFFIFKPVAVVLGVLLLVFSLLGMIYYGPKFSLFIGVFYQERITQREVFLQRQSRQWQEPETSAQADGPQKNDHDALVE